MAVNILIVEDEGAIARFLELELTHEAIPWRRPPTAAPAWIWP